MTRDDATMLVIRQVLRDHARKLEIDPDSIHSPSPHAITAMTADGALLRLDVSRYQQIELEL